MADLIDRAALLEAGNVRKMKDALEDWDTLDNKTKIIVLRYAKAHKKIIEHAPTVEAVEVVRCKECRHKSHALGLPNGALMCPFRTDSINDDSFCSRGERRTDADN